MIIVKTLFTFLFLVTFSISAFSSSNKKIIIQGNEQIDEEVIYSIIGNEYDSITNEDINEIIKLLYNTGSFSKIEIDNKDTEILIKVIENPKIGKIIFHGNKRFNKEVIFEQFEKEKYFRNYNVNKIDEFVYELKKLYHSFGYNIVDIEYKHSSDNKNDDYVDLNFYINEGKISKINKIYFVGNNNFNHNDLISEIKSKPKKLLNIFSNTNLKKYQVNNDLIRLKNFYRNNGFKNIKVDYKLEFISLKNKFNIYFYIDEGNKFTFNKFDLEYDSIKNLSLEQKEHLDLIIKNFYNNKIIKNISYNVSYIDDIKKIISDYLFDIGIVFFEIRTLEKINQYQADILFQITSTDPKYVNQINILGNTRTLEKVIRRQVTFAEGDPVNSNLIRQTNRNLNKLGLFNNVSIKEMSKENNIIDIEIEIEEISTGEFQAGLSFGTLQGASFITGLKEKNIAGAGREIDFTINTAELIIQNIILT